MVKLNELSPPPTFVMKCVLVQPQRRIDHGNQHFIITLLQVALTGDVVALMFTLKNGIVAVKWLTWYFVCLFSALVISQGCGLHDGSMRCVILYVAMCSVSVFINRAKEAYFPLGQVLFTV